MSIRFPSLLSVVVVTIAACSGKEGDSPPDSGGVSGSVGSNRGGRTGSGGSSFGGSLAASGQGGSVASTGGGGASSSGGKSAPSSGGAASSPTGGAPNANAGAAGAGSSGAPSGGSPSASTGGSAGAATGSGGCLSSSATGHFLMEDLDRGLVAVRSGDGNYVGWRMLGWEYDADAPERVAYNVYRDGAKVATVTDSTNYLDKGAPAGASYEVSAVLGGSECPKSAGVTPWAKDYLSIPLTPPPSGTTSTGESYSYNTATVRESSGSVNDGSPGDVDGDGQYEIVVIWEPSNAQDNSKPGHTGPVYLDCYKLNGTRLWRMNLGQNVRAGAHYTQFLVYDLDGDGRAEVALRTAPGTRDASGEYLSKGPAATDNDSMDYRNADGYVLSGPEYLTVFDGATGVELATENFEIARGKAGDWGDDYGNRVDRFLASVGYVSDAGSDGKGSGRPSLLMARGYYTRATVSAWNYRDGKLERIWTADSKTQGSAALAGQGAHSMVVADVDGDDAQEIVYGAAMIQSNGSFGCSTGLGHGDALHVGDFVGTRPGLEVFMPHEDKSQETWDIRDAKTCEILHSSGVTGSDNGRGVADDIIADNAGAEFWSASDANLRSASSGANIGAKPSSINFLLWWDADELRELEDATSIRKGDGKDAGGCSACMSNNYTKATPTLTADLFGDWREEIIWRTPTSTELRIFTTTAVTKRRLFTLMHDPQYRMQVSSEQTAYNQPPHPSFFIGDGMQNPAKPKIRLR
jgi:rhamnogalacturonan endolyase